MLDVHFGQNLEVGPIRRRQFLRVGALGLTGLTMADLLRLRSRAATGGEASRDTAVIQVFLGGGPSHIDTYDPKPDAPSEYRGEFRALATSVAGVAFSELLPRQARQMHRLAVVRSLHHTTTDHSEGSHWVLTGHAPRQSTPRLNERPSVGSVVAKSRGANRAGAGAGLPSYVAVPEPPAFGYASYLGPGENPFSPSGDLAANARVPYLDPPPGLTLDRLEDRRALLAKLDQADRRRDLSGTMAGLDRFTAEAYAMITGPAARRAFDLSLEDPRRRDRYGRTRVGQACLLALRLVESGVSFVTVNEPGWDHHGQIFPGCRRQLPALDAALAALVEDVYDRGLDRKVLLLVWGEFGRTPHVNGSAGRDHWPGAFSAVLAGGSLKTGQVVGETGRKGEAPNDRGVRPEDVIQTLYSVLGIDPSRTFPSENGRPMPILNLGRPIAELL
jgi:hypothetical protein